MPERTLPVLTIKQPWAWFHVSGIKPIENRSWAPPPWLVGKPYVVHAGAEYDLEGEDWIRTNFPAMQWPIGVHHVLSAILGVVELEAIILPHDAGLHTPQMADPVERLLAAGKVTAEDLLWWRRAQYGWVGHKAVRFATPIRAVKGKLGLWDLPAELYPVVQGRFYRELPKGLPRKALP